MPSRAPAAPVAEREDEVARPPPPWIGDIESQSLRAAGDEDGLSRSRHQDPRDLTAREERREQGDGETAGENERERLRAEPGDDERQSTDAGQEREREGRAQGDALGTNGLARSYPTLARCSHRYSGTTVDSTSSATRVSAGSGPVPRPKPPRSSGTIRCASTGTASRLTSSGTT